MTRYIGLMSGTSMDGVDAGLLTIGDSFRLERGITRPYPPKLRQRLQALVDDATRVSLDELGALDTAIARCFAAAALAVIDEAGLQPADIAALGSHGQTVRHQPHGEHAFSLQIGNASVIAAGTGIRTVSDFRSRDVALGGQGAPLAPAFHRAAFASETEVRAVVNLGGIANLTVLHPDGSVTGHDTGPGNVLMDAWIHNNTGADYDAGGDWARAGTMHRDLLDRLLDEPYFAKAPPKSTGRELFSLPWLTRRLIAMPEQPSAADVQATLCELSAKTIADAIERYAPGARRCLLCGGGARNRFLAERLAAKLRPIVVEPTDEHGLAAEWVEAAAFAWLAWRTMNGRPGNLPAVTGASAAAVLGSVTPADK